MPDRPESTRARATCDTTVLQYGTGRTPSVTPRAPFRERVYLRADGELPSCRFRAAPWCDVPCHAARRNGDPAGRSLARLRCPAAPSFDRRIFGRPWSALQRPREAAPSLGSARPSDPADRLVRGKAWPRPATAARKRESRRDRRTREPLPLQGRFRSGPSPFISAPAHSC
jgi:hypothetical protein